MRIGHNWQSGFRTLTSQRHSTVVSCNGSHDIVSACDHWLMISCIVHGDPVVGTLFWHT